MTSENRQIVRSEYHYGLLEKIISKENLNEAFRRVKKFSENIKYLEYKVSQRIYCLKQNTEPDLKQVQLLF